MPNVTMVPGKIILVLSVRDTLPVHRDQDRVKASRDALYRPDRKTADAVPIAMTACLLVLSIVQMSATVRMLVIPIRGYVLAMETTIVPARQCVPKATIVPVSQCAPKATIVPARQFVPVVTIVPARQCVPVAVIDLIMVCVPVFVRLHPHL